MIVSLRVMNWYHFHYRQTGLSEFYSILQNFLDDVNTFWEFKTDFLFVRGDNDLFSPHAGGSQIIPSLFSWASESQLPWSPAKLGHHATAWKLMNSSRRIQLILWTSCS